MKSLSAALLARTAFPFPPERHDGDLPMLLALADASERVDLLAQCSADHGPAPLVAERGRLRIWYGPSGSSPLATARWLWWAYWTLRRIAHDGGLDIVNGSDLFGALVAVHAARSLGSASVVQLQGDFLANRPGTYRPGRAGLVRRLALYVARRADRVRCLFGASADALVEAGMPSDRIVILPSRCDVRRFDPRTSSISAAPEQLLFIGNVVNAKGVPELLEAVARLCERRPGVCLTIVGDGRDVAALQSHSSALGLAARVRWLGRRPASELPALIASHAALVLPSRSEGTPRVLLEAMAMGRPVVATRVGGIPDIVRHGEDGWLVSPGDIVGLESALDTILAAQPWPVSSACASRAHVIEKYSLEAHVRGMLSLHQAAAGHHRGGKA